MILSFSRGCGICFLVKYMTSHSCHASVVEKVVCYLNSYGKDFEGGLFNFQDGEPKTFAPTAGVCTFTECFSRFSIHHRKYK